MAFSMAGEVRSFLDPAVHESILANVVRPLGGVAERHERAARVELLQARADRVEDLHVERLQRAVEQQRDVGPVVRVADGV